MELAGSRAGSRPHSAATFQSSLGKPHSALYGTCLSISLKRGITLARTKAIMSILPINTLVFSDAYAHLKQSTSV